MPGTQKHCTECAYCSWERIDADGRQWPCCNNPGMKLYLLPDGAKACDLFESRPAPSVSPQAMASAVQKRLSRLAEHRRLRSSTPQWQVIAQGLELLAMGVAGAGASNLGRTSGVIAFGCGLGLAVVSLVARLSGRH